MGTAYVTRESVTGDRTMPVTSPARSTNAPPADAAPDGAAVSRRPLVVGPSAIATLLSVDATSPLLIQSDESPGLGAPTTHTVSPVRAARTAVCTGTPSALGADFDGPPASAVTARSTRSVVVS